MIKPVNNEKITLEKCPYCGGDTYYEKTYLKGAVINKYKFVTYEPVEYEGKYDGLFELYGADYIYCDKCNKRLCRKEDFNGPKNK